MMRRTTNLATVTVKSDALPKRCWVQRGKNYTLLSNRRLPIIGSQHESVLKELDIPYEVVELPDTKVPGKTYTACMFWDPEIYQVEDVKLPVYQQIESAKDTYKNTGRKREAMVLSYETVTMALEKRKVVMQAIEARKKAPTKVDEEFLIKQLGDKTAKVVKIANAEIVEGISEELKIIPAYNASGEPNGYYGIFNMNKLKWIPVIKLTVPEAAMGKIKGTGGQNKAFWEYSLGKEIQLISVKR